MISFWYPYFCLFCLYLSLIYVCYTTEIYILSKSVCQKQPLTLILLEAAIKTRSAT